MKNALLLLALVAVSLADRCSADEMDPSAAFAKSMVKAIRIISKNHFTPASEAQLADWSIRGLYDNLKEPMPADITRRLEKLDKAKAEEIERLLRDAHAALKSRKELANGRAVEVCIEAIFLKLEPGAQPEHRNGLVPVDNRPCGIGQLRFGDRGVGLKLEIDPRTTMLRVVTPLFDGPAHKAGIRAGDLITEIRLDVDRDGNPLVEPDNQENPAPSPRIYSTKGMTVERAMDLLRGKPGTSVKVTVIPAK